ncbi:two-component regulatory system response regulator PhoB [Bacteroidales bacterium]|nr:two-component regulatory system response regulator PhoB [Bacteroidales bacterium]
MNNEAYTQNKRTNLLVVDDEADIRDILQFNLENEGFIVDTASSAEQALKILNQDHQLILLDVMMGGMSGFHMAEALRKEGNTIPIIFLTAKSTQNDVLTGFSIGGDDYISKPFSIKELVARVKAIEMRMTLNRSTPRSNMIVVEGLILNIENKQIEIDGQSASLTKKEFEILLLLLKNKERIYSRNEILDIVWGDDGYVLERTVDVHIARLRKKIGKYGSCINNRSGYGYCFLINHSS